jgi:hypothetical protein
MHTINLSSKPRKLTVPLLLIVLMAKGEKAAARRKRTVHENVLLVTIEVLLKVDL